MVSGVGAKTFANGAQSTWAQTTDPPASITSDEAQLTADIVNLFIAQIRHGCGHDDCPAPLCYTYRTRRSAGPLRKPTDLSARSTALVLASTPDPRNHLCPYVRPDISQSTTRSGTRKIDHKALLQQLSLTDAANHIETVIPRPDFASNLDQDFHGLSEGWKNMLQNVLDGELQCISCRNLLDMRNALILFNRLLDKHDLVSSDTPKCVTAMQTTRTAMKRALSLVLGNYNRLADSFSDSSLHLSPGDAVRCAPLSWTVTSLPLCLEKWQTAAGPMLFDLLYHTLESISPKVIASETISSLQSDPLLHGSWTYGHDRLVRVLTVAITALYMRVPQTSSMDWAHFGFSHLGLATGSPSEKRKTDASCLALWDALSYQPAVRLSHRLLEVISEYDATIDVLYASLDRSSIRFPRISEFHMREALLTPLSQARLNTKPDGHASLSNQGIVVYWLPWLRLAFSRNWNGHFFLDRHGIAGTALATINAMCKSSMVLDIYFLADKSP